jgi:3-hydroxyisobutyrate dehydrogenase
MDLVQKDTGLFLDIAEAGEVPVELAPKIREIFADGQARYGERAWSSQIVKRLEDACGVDLRADGYPAELLDDEPEEPGYEVRLDPPGATGA